MWIPWEAVYAVYPETGSAFLAAKGDEIEHFGWNLPPGELPPRSKCAHAAAIVLDEGEIGGDRENDGRRWPLPRLP